MNIAKNAKELLEDLNLHQVPVCPKEVCRKLGIVYDEQPYSGFDGLLLVDGDNQLIGVSSDLKEETRKIYTCAHELGHYYYDIGSGGLIKCNRDDLGYGKQSLNEKENRANQFASELLLPADFFSEDIKNKEPSWDLIQSLASKYGTSLQATATRFVNLTHHTCWIVIARKGKLQRFVKSNFNDFLVDLNNIFKPSKNKALDWLSVTAENWLYENHKTRGKELLLWPLTENRYGETLMLLWDCENSLLDYDSDEEFEDSYDDSPWRR